MTLYIWDFCTRPALLRSSMTLANVSNASSYSNLQEMSNLQPELRLSCCNRMHEANPAGQENRGTHMRISNCFCFEADLRGHDAQI